MGGLDTTIAGKPIEHRLYHFRLAFSGFEPLACPAAPRGSRAPRRRPPRGCRRDGSRGSASIRYWMAVLNHAFTAAMAGGSV
jgi:hypothetical protein